MPQNDAVAQIGLDEYKFGFSDPENYLYKSR